VAIPAVVKRTNIASGNSRTCSGIWRVTTRAPRQTGPAGVTSGPDAKTRASPLGREHRSCHKRERMTLLHLYPRSRSECRLPRDRSTNRRYYFRTVLRQFGNKPIFNGPAASSSSASDGGARWHARPRLGQGWQDSADAAGGIPRSGITWRGGNNDRLSTLWREVISLSGVARSFLSGGG
jgi:hypothetical protein